MQPEQLAIDFTGARQRGAAMGKAALDKAVRVGDFDAEGARRFIVAHLAWQGQMSGEGLVHAAREHGFRPHDDRAFGPIFAGLVKRGQIRCVGYCARERGHGTAGGRVWALNR